MALCVFLGLAAVACGQMLTSNTIRGMANNTLFERWRPYSHFSAPAGWMNVSLPVAPRGTTLTPA